MPPKVPQTSVSAEQLQLLCQVVQHCDSPKKESWDAIAQKLGITHGGAAQQRFGRLLKALKAADLTGSPTGGALKAKAVGKRSASGKANGRVLKKPKYREEEEEEDEDGENDDELFDDEETPSKKRKVENETWAPKLKSVIGEGGGTVKVKDEDESDGVAAGGKDKDDLDEEVAN